MSKHSFCKKCNNTFLKSIFFKEGVGDRKWMKINKLYCPNCDKIFEK
jgi:acetone carboxylase gamma subunit